MIALFIGNDLSSDGAPARRLARTPRRSARVRARAPRCASRRARPRGGARGRGRARGGSSRGQEVKELVPPRRVTAVFPWFADRCFGNAHLLGRGLSQIEERALAITRPTEGYACFDWLEDPARRARHPLLVMMIPDEFRWRTTCGPTSRPGPEPLRARPAPGEGRRVLQTARHRRAHLLRCAARPRRSPTAAATSTRCATRTGARAATRSGGEGSRGR